MESLEVAIIAAKALDNKKGRDIKVLKVHDLTVLADYFVIATGTSNTQVGALADEVEFKLSQVGVEPSRIEGAQTRNWILLDYSGVVVHVFHPDAREHYALERLWADAEPVEIDLDEA